MSFHPISIAMLNKKDITNVKGNKIKWFKFFVHESHSISAEIIKSLFRAFPRTIATTPKRKITKKKDKKIAVQYILV